MKNKIAIVSALIAASSFSFAEIDLTEAVSVKGFINTVYSDSDAGDAEFNLDEVEISFLFDMGAVTGQIDTQYRVFNDGQFGSFTDTDIDQAFINYDVFGGTLTVGLFDSQLGYEAYEAVDRVTGSTAYSNSQLPGSDLFQGNTNADTGVKFTKQLDEVSSIGVALVDEGSFIGDEGNGDTTIEVAYGRDLGNGFNAFVGFRSDRQSNDLMNAYVTYETGAMTFAAEIVDGETETDYQLLANYAYSDTASVTLRFTNEEGAGNNDDIDQMTLAHQIALADSLLLTTELTDNGADDNEYEFGVSLLFRF